MVRAQLNLILTQDQPPPVIKEAPKKLLFVEAIINSTSTKKLVDLEATHNFLSEKEAHDLGLSLVNFLVLWMNDFDVILGANFTTKVKARIFFHYNGILICGGKRFYFI
ncbi:unnamed protein product [Spirodela intermedia]|uniref:Uncharacterized protein n=1 Tax=Spirodela intermedia TaxID=51605 RepID=A0A7I8L1T7_SPIIN|nr:unnamed protein product [Spirodela intermedia]